MSRPRFRSGIGPLGREDLARRENALVRRPVGRLVKFRLAVRNRSVRRFRSSEAGSSVYRLPGKTLAHICCTCGVVGCGDQRDARGNRRRKVHRVSYRIWLIVAVTVALSSADVLVYAPAKSIVVPAARVIVEISKFRRSPKKLKLSEYRTVSPFS